MIRPCKFCGKTVDFSEEWCDHETMEESAILDIKKRFSEAAYEIALNQVIDDAVFQAAQDLMPNARPQV